MQLKGKKIVIIGDSITEGVGTSSYENSYPAVLERLSGATVYNYGVSGTRYAYQTEEFEPNFSESFSERIRRIKEEPDVILVFGGTNDFGHGDAPFGSEEDCQPTTYCGACRYIYTYLLQKYPTAKLVILTPLHRTSENSPIKEVRDIPTLPLIEYVKVQRRLAEYYSIPVIDLFSISGMQPAIDSIREIYMPDGLHPSDEGAKRLAHLIYAQLLTL